MKKISILTVIGLSFIANQGKAQDSTKTLFHMPKINTVGLYIAPEYQYGQINSKLTSLGGISAMAIFNEKFAIGATMNRTMVRDLQPINITNTATPLYLRVNYGGLKMEYTVNPHSLVHVSFPLTVGMGNASYDSIGSFRTKDTTHRMSMMNQPRNGNQFFVIQPGIQLEANLMKVAKVYLGANYRFAFNQDNANTLSTKYMTGFGVYGGLKIGLFDYKIKGKTSKN